jgi:hypothetical protein
VAGVFGGSGEQGRRPASSEAVAGVEEAVAGGDPSQREEGGGDLVLQG